jgi:hypothetical protein
MASYDQAGSPGKQRQLDFESHERITVAAAIARELGDNMRWWLLRNVALPDGTTNRGKRVMGATLARIIRAIHIYPVPCWASAKTLAAKTAEGSESALSEKTVDNGLQVLRRQLGPNRHGNDAFEPLLWETPYKRGISNRYILWQYLIAYLPPKLRAVYDRKRHLSAAALLAATGELSSPLLAATGELKSDRPGNRGSRTGEPSSHESGIESVHESVLHPNDDGDGDVCLLKERANRFAQIFPCRRGPLRERVLRICRLWIDGALPHAVCEDVLAELQEIKDGGGIKKARGLLFRLFKNRGYDLDRMIVPVPTELMTPPAERQVAP